MDGNPAVGSELLEQEMHLHSHSHFGEPSGACLPPQTPGEPVAPAHYDNISNPSATCLISLPSQLPICKTMIAIALASQEAEKLSRNLNSP